MKTYLIHVDEIISHCYKVEADSEEGALEAYDKFTDGDFIVDLDGSSSWNSPWDVEEESK